MLGNIFAQDSPDFDDGCGGFLHAVSGHDDFFRLGALQMRASIGNQTIVRFSERAVSLPPGNDRVIGHLIRNRKLARSFDEGIVFVELVNAVGDVLQDRGLCRGSGVGASREGVAEG